MSSEAVRSKRRDRMISIASPLIVLLIWEIASRWKLVDPRIIPPPSEVAIAVVKTIQDGSLVKDTLITVARFITGLLVGVIPGIAIGLSMGLFRPIRAALDPLVGVLSSAPRLALFPFVLILFGLNEMSNIIMIALGPFFTMLITAMGAVVNVDSIYKDVARNFNAPRKALYTRIMLPAISPALMDGLRISVGLGLLGTVAVEFLVGGNGLGHLIWSSWQVLSLKQSMVGLVAARLAMNSRSSVAASIVGWLFYASLNVLQAWIVPWKQTNIR